MFYPLKEIRMQRDEGGDGHAPHQRYVPADDGDDELGHGRDGQHDQP
jgi:hypothetical protein